MLRFTSGSLTFVAVAFILGGAQDTPAQNAGKAAPKNTAKKAAPKPFTGPEVELLPGFCEGTNTPVAATTACSDDKKFAQARNAASIAENIPKIDKYSNFVLRPDGDSRIVITCKTGVTCDSSLLTPLKAAISGAARRYTVQCPTEGAGDKGGKIATRFHALHPEVEATAIDSIGVIELASGAPIGPAARGEIHGMIVATLNPVVMPLPLFCLSGFLAGAGPQRVPQPPPPAPSPAYPCGGSPPVQATNASQVAKALTNDPSFTVTADSKILTEVLIVCKDVCSPEDLLRIEGAVSELGWPSPAYRQDEETPIGFAAVVAKKINDLKLMGITADAIGVEKVRLKSDSPVAYADVQLIMDVFRFGESAPPEFRMFYQNAGTVIQSIASPVSSSAGGGNAGNSSSAAPKSPAPSSASSSQADSSSGDSNSTTVKITTTSDTSTTVKGQPSDSPSPQKATAGGAAAPAPAAPAAKDAATKPAGGGTPPVTTTNSTAVTFTPPPPPDPKPPAAPTPPAIGTDMAVFNDNVVFTNPTDDALTWQRVRLLTLLDLPRPEVLMNMWSYQASSDDGNVTLRRAEKLRDLVTAYNDALENSIGYGWAYLSRQMKADPLNQPHGEEWPKNGLQVNANTGKIEVTARNAQPNVPPEFLPDEILQPRRSFFERDFYNYITQKFVFDRQRCTEPGCKEGTPLLSDQMRTQWGFCPAGKYCLGFPQAFQPVRPNLTSILMGAIASRYPLKTILTAIGCMEGKYEVYGSECFPDRPAFSEIIRAAKKDLLQTTTACQQEKEKNDEQIRELRELYLQKKQELSEAGAYSRTDCVDCTTRLTNQLKEIAAKIDGIRRATPCPGCDSACQVKLEADEATQRENARTIYQLDTAREKACIKDERARLVREKRNKDSLSCELLDTVALEAQANCGVVQTFPLSCFTIQAAQSFSSPADFSTFTLEDLNALAEERLADLSLPEGALPGSPYSTTRIGLLRAAVADFLFNYKMSQEFPKDFVPYDLQHSAQELNAELNPLVVAFNQDVAAFSRNLQSSMDAVSRKSFVSDGIITVRGIGTDQSTVDTITQNFFDATQAKSLSDLANSLTGQGGSNQSGGSTPASGASALTALTTGALTAATVAPALAALIPKPTQAKIGRELYLQITPHTLPGASSAELEVTLRAGDTADPTLYQSGSSVGTDNLSRVSQHNVTTRVRVESVKMFELSSFSAMLQRPRGKLPLVPPFIQLPWIGSLASLPLKGAKEYHRSTAVVSAVIVPTAADLAYGIDFSHDRLITGEEEGRFGHNYRMRSILSLTEVRRAPIRAFHKAMVNCFATNGLLPFAGGAQFDPRAASQTCGNLTFAGVPPEVW